MKCQPASVRAVNVAELFQSLLSRVLMKSGSDLRA